MLFNAMKRLGPVVICSFLLSALGPVHAGDLIGPDLTLYRTDADQDDPAIAYNTLHDEYLVVWGDTGGTVHDIKAARLSATGGELAQFTVASSSDRRYNPEVAYDPVNDQYLVVYSKEYIPTDFDICGRIIPWDGLDGNLPEILIGGASHDEMRPDVAYGRGGPAAGQFLVTWTIDAASDWHIRGAFVSPTDGTVGTPWRISPESRGFDDSRLAYLDTRDQFLVAAVEYFAAADENVSGVILDTNGDPQHGGWFSIAVSTDDEVLPDVAAFPAADQYVVAFVRNTGEFDVKVQRVGGNSSLIGSVIDVDRSSFSALFPRVTCMQTSPGCCLIAWQQMSNSSPTPSGVEARMMDGQGQLSGMLWIIDPSITDATRQYPDVAPGSPEFFAVWSHQRDTLSSLDLHGSLVMPLVFLDGFESSDTSLWSTHTP